MEIRSQARLGGKSLEDFTIGSGRAGRPLDELQALFFQAPLWLEAATGDWVILPQLARRQLVLKRWREDRGVLTAPTLTGLVALMRAHQAASQLLAEDEQAPLQAWLVAEPTVEKAPALPGSL